MKKVLAAVAVTLVLLVGAYFGYKTFVVSGAQEDLSETADQSTIRACESIKQNSCALNGQVSEEDYSDSCFQNGEHILENPYTCSG